MREARDVATSTTRLALSQSTRSRTNRVWHWRTLRRCRRGMIRMIQAAAHPRTPHSTHPDPPRYTATDPAPPLPTHPHQPHPHPPPQRARESAAGGWWRRRAAGCGRRRRAAGSPTAAARAAADVRRSPNQRSYACGFHHPPHLSWYCRISTRRRRRIICERPCTIPLLHLRIAHAIVPSPPPAESSSSPNVHEKKYIKQIKETVYWKSR